MEYQAYQVQITDHIAHVMLNRPDKANALNQTGWDELKLIFERLDEEEEVRVIVLSGAGKHFCSGIDVSMFMMMGQDKSTDEGRKREKLRRFILALQDSVSAIEKCRKPVLAAIHRGCIGGGVDIASACDIRYCTEDAYFTIKEIDMGMVADLGTLQRLPKIIGEGIVREMAYTGRNVYGPEAASIGLANQSYPDKESMMESVMNMAKMIAAKSPLSIRGTKEVLNYTRDHTVEEGLNYIATWNAGMLLSEDLMTAVQASMTKKVPNFNN